MAGVSRMTRLLPSVGKMLRRGLATDVNEMKFTFACPASVINCLLMFNNELFCLLRLSIASTCSDIFVPHSLLELDSMIYWPFALLFVSSIEGTLWECIEIMNIFVALAFNL